MIIIKGIGIILILFLGIKIISRDYQQKMDELQKKNEWKQKQLEMNQIDEEDIDMEIGEKSYIICSKNQRIFYGNPQENIFEEIEEILNINLYNYHKYIEIENPRHRALNAGPPFGRRHCHTLNTIPENWIEVSIITKNKTYRVETRSTENIKNKLFGWKTKRV